MLFYRDFLHRKPFFFSGVLLLGGVLSAGGQNLVVTPATGAVYQGQTQTFKTNQPVTWSLMKGSAGTLQVNSSTSATYTAPSWVIPTHTRGGCQATPEDSVFNTRIDKLPVLTSVNGNTNQNSAKWIAGMNSSSIGIGPDFGVNLVNPATPSVNEVFDYTPSHDGPFSSPPQPTQTRQGGAYQTDLNNTDHHLISVNTSNCQFYEVYKNYFSPRTCLNGSAGCTARSGVSYAWSSYALPAASTQASNLLYGPTLLHLSEIKAGAIRHALSFTLSEYTLQRLAYWPANSTNTVYNNPSAPPYGARLRLKASFDISSFSPAAQTILTALKQYGMFLSDAGGHGPAIFADSDVSGDAAVMAGIYQIDGAGISALDFDVVDESSFIVSPNSMEVNPANGYETPNTFAVLTATPASGAAITVPIALGSDVPAVPSPTLYIIAGTPSYSLTNWTRSGLPYQPVRWTLISGVGVVTPNGLYIPPASVAGPVSAVLQVALLNNPDLFDNVYVTVLPAGANPAGSIRIDVGSNVSTTDQSGNVWLADTAFESADSYARKDYPSWTSPGNTEINIYNTFRYTEDDDLTYTLGVPNGNYKVRLMMGAPYNGHSCPQPCTYNVLEFPTDWGPYHLIANGQVAVHNFDFGLPISHKGATPSDAFIPAQVTNNQLSISVRGNRPDSMAGYAPVLPVLEGIEILPDTTAPHLTIDAQQQTSVAPGNQLQLYSVGWYMGNAVTWSVISGPGSIDQTGLYSAPAIAPPSAETVTIRATSTANNAISASLALSIP